MHITRANVVRRMLSGLVLFELFVVFAFAQSSLTNGANQTGAISGSGSV